MNFTQQKSPPKRGDNKSFRPQCCTLSLVSYAIMCLEVRGGRSWSQEKKNHPCPCSLKLPGGPIGYAPIGWGSNLIGEPIGPAYLEGDEAYPVGCFLHQNHNVNGYQVNSPRHENWTYGIFVNGYQKFNYPIPIFWDLSTCHERFVKLLHCHCVKSID